LSALRFLSTYILNLNNKIFQLIQFIYVFYFTFNFSLLIGFVKDQDEPQWRGYVYAALLLVTATCQTILLSQYFNRMFLVGLRIRTALISSIYRKVSPRFYPNLFSLLFLM
jgi:ATP-binding cassette subfamily C (CFTR/MRP) protein 1